VGATTYSYDTRGNRTSKVPTLGSATCDAYDQANRLTAITTGTSSICAMPTTVSTYAYDGTGLRSSKTVGATMTQFAWDRSAGLPLLLQEKVGTIATSYIYGPEGLPLEQITSTGTAYWYHHDQLGSTRALTDSSGTRQATYTYDSYGNLTALTGIPTNPLQFAGEYTDAESGLQYLRARHYEPATGQFLTRDPLEGLTQHAYAYAQDDPLNNADPSGLSSCGDFSIGGLVDCGAKVGNAVEKTVVDTTIGIDEGLVGPGCTGTIGPTTGYKPPPQRLPAFPDAKPTKRKTPFPGGKRQRWVDGDGNIYEWDYQHGTVEKYDRKGRHQGEFDPDTGRQLKPANPQRTVEP
jgi:RHS repeat-associated protein